MKSGSELQKWQMTGYRIWLVILVVVCCMSCGDSKQEKNPIVFAAEQRKTSLLKDIDSLETKLKQANPDAPYDRASALHLVRLYQDYYNQNSKDTLSGEFLFRAASLSVTLEKPQQAVNRLVTYYDTYKTASRRPEALYLIGFIYENEMDNPEKALEFYDRVIEVFPDNFWAEQARAAKTFLGLSEEEIIKKLESGHNP